MNIWFSVCLMGLLYSNTGIILTIDNENYSLQQFYTHYSKKHWAQADSSQRNKMYSDFIRRELCIMEAKKLGFERDPYLAVKIYNRSLQLLVNESYEQLVALPLINPDDIAEAYKFALTEISVSHILIGYSGSYLARPPERSIDDALILAQNIRKQLVDGSDFAILAEKYSDDPSVEKNFGSIGWVQWGATVPEFQSAAFKLDIGMLSDPVLTDFGFHIILATDRRQSDFQYMSNKEYENAIINLAKVTVRDRLRNAAIVYDSLQIKLHDVYFNVDAILKIVQKYSLKQKEGISKQKGKINTSDLLESATDVGVVCVYDKKGFGARWFANKISRIPSSRQPALDSKENILSVFNTIILQDIAIKNAYEIKVDSSFAFLEKKNYMVSDVLYDAFLKHLVNNVSKPDTLMVQEYYDNNMVEKYMTSGTVLIREIRVQSRILADSLLLLIQEGDSLGVLAQKYSLINPDNGGLSGPFSRNSNKAFFDAAMLLDLGAVSPVLSAPGGQFSIIQLLEKKSGIPLELTSVYSRIQSILLKESQETSKKNGVEGLFKKFKIKRYSNLLNL